APVPALAPVPIWTLGGAPRDLPDPATPGCVVGRVRATADADPDAEGRGGRPDPAPRPGPRGGSPVVGRPRPRHRSRDLDDRSGPRAVGMVAARGARRTGAH